MNYPDDFINKIICGDCLEVMKEMPKESIDMCMTSPPYWEFRDYGVEQIFGENSECEHEWNMKIQKKNMSISGKSTLDGFTSDNIQIRKLKIENQQDFCSKCQAWKGQLGLEPTPELYIEHLTEIFNEVKRVLKKEGTFFLNMGDSYATTSGRQGKGDLYGKQPKVSKDVDKVMPIQWKIDLPQKCLCMIPERLAWSLIQNGWILRNKIPWIKPNSMPSSAKDRFANKWEYIFYFVKSQRNYFDLDSIRESHKEKTFTTIGTIRKSLGTDSLGKIKSHNFAMSMKKRKLNPAGVNPGDIWTIPTAHCPVRGIHYSTFPEELCRKAIIPGCPEGGIVLDPFAGIGTTGYVARKLGRKFIMIDIKKEFCDKAENKRLAQGVL